MTIRHIYGYKFSARIKAWKLRRQGRHCNIRWELVNEDGTVLAYLRKGRNPLGLLAFYSAWPKAKVAWVVYEQEPDTITERSILGRIGRVGNFVLGIVFGSLFTIFGWLFVLDVFWFHGLLYDHMEWWGLALSLFAFAYGTVIGGPFLLLESWKIYKGKEVST